MTPAFIVGVGRSGTSIIGETLSRHPGVFYLFEDAVWASLGFEDRADTRMSAADLTIERKELLDRWTRQAGTRLLVEKNPRHVGRLGFIRAVFPGCRLVHAVRDGRDVAVSIREAIRRAGPDGLAVGHVPWGGWDCGDPRYPIDSIQYAATVWTRLLTTALPILEGVGVLTVRYCDFVAAPECWANRMIQHLGLLPSREVVRFVRRRVIDRADGYAAQHQDVWGTSRSGGRVERWRTELSPEEIAAIDPIVGPLRHRFGFSS